MISVEHNSLRLPAYIALEVRSLTAAKKFVEKFMAAKRPRGLKIRHSYECRNNTVYAEARNAEALNYFVSALRSTGNVANATRQRIALQE